MISLPTLLASSVNVRAWQTRVSAAPSDANGVAKRQAAEAVSGKDEAAQRSAAALEASRSAATGLAQSMKDARDAMRGEAKARAKSTVQRLKEEVALIRKMWANNPKAMAQQLARVSKQLKEAVKDYAAANKAYGAAPTGGVAAPPASAPVTATEPSVNETSVGEAGVAEAKESDGAGTAALKPDEKAPEPSAAALADAVASYALRARAHVRREETPEALEAKGDLDFPKMVRGFLNKIREELTLAKMKAMDEVSVGDGGDAFKDAEKAVKSVDEEVGDLETEVRASQPVETGGLVSAVA